jgi:serine protease Do
MEYNMTKATQPILNFGINALVGILLIGSFWCPAVHAFDNDAVARLKEVEKKINQVVSNNMETCVAVFDGVGFGSGVIISAEGLVLTAGHVMASPDKGQYVITLSSGRRVKAKALGKNLDTDTGMIQILEPGPWPFVKLNQNKFHTPGSWVVSLGHSGGWKLGRKPPVRTGRILYQRKHQLLTDAVLIGGDSGGPLFNLDGQLIGIHSSIGDSIAENRHVTTTTFLRDWVRLQRGESWGQLPELNEPDDKTRRGLMGVRVDKTAPNCLIKSVEIGSPAGDIGIQIGDIVTEFDNIVIKDGQRLIDVIKTKYAGDVCPITIQRNGNTLRFEIMLR